GSFTFKDAEDFARNHEDSVCCGHVQVMPQGALLNTPAFKTLRAAPFVGTEADPVNLAGIWNNDPSATISTANCYMINGPGYYNIPLVYGNAIKNGAVNPICWHSTDAPMKYGSPSFQNHLGNAIDNAYIKNCGATIHDAAIMSTFNQHAVQLVHLSDDYLTIYVDPEFIDQGSTVVVIRDTNGDIMWSWHLWLTYLNPYKDKGAICTVPTRTGETFEFMTANLGWHTNDGNGYTAARAIYWKPAQQRRKSKYQSDQHEEESGLYITKNRYRITQDKYIRTSSGFAPNYNWGRKDPLMRTVHGDKNKINIRGLYNNLLLTTHGNNGDEYTLRQGYYFFKNFTPGESVKVPWAIPTFYNLSWRMDTIMTDYGPAVQPEINEGATTNTYYATWWTGNRDGIYRPGPVPLKKELWNASGVWPGGVPNGAGPLGTYANYTRYDDLWCINQDGLGYLSHEQGDRVPIKTVYDPCPPGFMVPPNRAFDNLNSSTGDYRFGMYSFMDYNLHFPAMPFLSNRIGRATVVFDNGGFIMSNYYGVYEEVNGQPFANEYLDYAYFYPFTQSLFGQTMTVWTSDVSALRHGENTFIIGSFYNVTGSFIVNPAPLLAANGSTMQMGGSDARATGNTWSSAGRQVRGVKEKQ
ncbi:MAG: hypothetical protein K2I18_08220, partial [Paramuribaculum sp.]|nr:hypothetical protein [Paramuribaculum sp.]